MQEKKQPQNIAGCNYANVSLSHQRKIIMRIETTTTETTLSFIYFSSIIIVIVTVVVLTI